MRAVGQRCKNAAPSALGAAFFFTDSINAAAAAPFHIPSALRLDDYWKVMY